MTAHEHEREYEHENVPLEMYEQAVRERAHLRVTHIKSLLQLGELCDAAQAVLDGKACLVDSAGDRYVIDQTLQTLEAVLRKIRSGA